MAKPLSTPLVPYGDESEGSSDQGSSGSIIEVHDHSIKPACSQRRVPTGIGIYTCPNTPSDINLGATSQSRFSTYPIVIKSFAVVRIPPSAVLSYKNAPAIPASCPRVRHVNESCHNGTHHVTIPTPLDQPEEDPEFALAFALSVQMLAGPPIMNSIETDLTLIQEAWIGQQVVWLSAKPTPGVCPPRNILGRK